MIDANKVFDDLQGNCNGGYPVIDVPVFHTSNGTTYLKAPGVACIAKPSLDLEATKGFLGGFDDSLGFEDYLEDPQILNDGNLLPDSAMLCKFAGQSCYASYGPKRTKNGDAVKYFDHIISSGHLSVLEHANFSFLFYGISRSVTHELVRHRHHSPSQLSQRYVGGNLLRFVERQEFQNDEELHRRFEDHIERSAKEYEELTELLLAKQAKGDQLLSGESRTDMRKKVRQAARSVLPNDTEAPIVVTGNARAWRYFLGIRPSKGTEIEIRDLAVRVFLCLFKLDPVLFGDYTLETLKDGTYIVTTKYNKI